MYLKRHWISENLDVVQVSYIDCQMRMVGRTEYDSFICRTGKRRCNARSVPATRCGTELCPSFAPSRAIMIFTAHLGYVCNLLTSWYTFCMCTNELRMPDRRVSEATYIHVFTCTMHYIADRFTDTLYLFRVVY